MGGARQVNRPITKLCDTYHERGWLGMKPKGGVGEAVGVWPW